MGLCYKTTFGLGFPADHVFNVLGREDYGWLDPECKATWSRPVDALTCARFLVFSELMATRDWILVTRTARSETAAGQPARFVVLLGLSPRSCSAGRAFRCRARTSRARSFERTGSLSMLE